MKTRKFSFKIESIHGRNFVNISSLQLLHYIHGYTLEILRKENEEMIPTDGYLLNLHLVLFASVVSPSTKKTYLVRLFVITHTIALLLRATTLKKFKFVLLRYPGKVNIHVSILNIGFY